jgi:hypothetical protein
MFIRIPRAVKILANPRGEAIEDLTFIKKYVIIIKKRHFYRPEKRATKRGSKLTIIK